MAIKSELKQPDPNIDYPKLMVHIHNQLVILFTEEKIGLVLHPGDTTWAVGADADNWEMDRFEDFHGSITLTQP